MVDSRSVRGIIPLPRNYVRVPALKTSSPGCMAAIRKSGPIAILQKRWACRGRAFMN